MAKRNVVVIGASAGGVEALISLAESLPADLDASIFVVLHVPANGVSVLPRILSRSGPLPAEHPKHGTVFQPGRIYVAPPDRHLVLHDRHVCLTVGPRENGHRPAVDPLFRSAARVFGNRVVAVLLSGSGDDGTAGLLSVRRAGGVAIAQDPAEALCAGMPEHAIEIAGVDHVLSVAEIGGKLAQLVREEVEEMRPADAPGDLSGQEDLRADYQLTEAGEDPPSLSGFTCPECGGRLWEIQEPEMVRYRCRVGHAYSPDSLLTSNTSALEGALWAALNALEEHAALSRRLANDAHQRRHVLTARRFEDKAADTERQADLLRNVLRVEVSSNGPGLETISEEDADTAAPATYLRGAPENVSGMG